MTIYKVTSETVNVISVNGKAVQKNMIRTHRVIDGNMDNVARVIKKQLNFLVLNTIDRATEDVDTESRTYWISLTACSVKATGTK